MITSVISSAARLPLAPARLAGRMAGALLRGLRGNDSGGTSSGRSSARTTAASGSRARTQTKRAGARGSAKAQPTRAAARGSAKAKPKRTGARSSTKAQPKRTPARARPKSQPAAAPSQRSAGPEPLGDVAIAREVESTIFRDVDVHRGQVDVKVAEGVVRLRGEVRTPDLINELEARAARVPQVRRVENLLRTPAPESATPTPQQVDPASPLGTSRPPAPPIGRPEGAAGRPTGAPEGRPEPGAGHPEGEESAGNEERRPAELDKNPAY